MDKIPLDAGTEELMNDMKRLKTQNSKALFVGNGGSAAIASHIAVDFWKRGGIRAISFNDSSLLTCVSNDYCYEEVFSKPIEMFCDPGDILFAISSSGKSPNILNAVKQAKENGCFTVTLSGFSTDNPLRRLGDRNFYLQDIGYGIVEIGHLTILHYLIDEYLTRQESMKEESSKKDLIFS